MLAQLSKTLSTNVAIAGLSLVVLGAGGTSATLAAGHSPTPSSTHASDTAKQKAADKAADPSADAAEAATEAAEENEGTRPTDTHGFCVSQVAKAAPQEPTGEGADKVTHGSLVSAAAHACGKDDAAKAAKKAAAKAHGKAFGKHRGTGRPAAVTPGAAPAR